MATQDLINKVGKIKKKISVCSEWEKDFIKSLSARLDQYGEKTTVSDKQVAVIEKCFEKISQDKPDAKAKSEKPKATFKSDSFDEPIHSSFAGFPTMTES